MEYIAFVFAILGLVAFVRVEKLVKTLKEQGVLDQDYKEVTFSDVVGDGRAAGFEDRSWPTSV